MQIKSFSQLSEEDINKWSDFKDNEFNRNLCQEKAKFNLKIKKFIIYFFCGLIVAYFILIFLSVLGIITSPVLEGLFKDSMLILVTTFVGFALGYFYDKEK